MIPKEPSLGKTRKIKPKVANTKEVISSVRGDKEYIVEKIVGHKKIKGKFTFEIKWKNYTKTSWEDKSYLDKFICDDVNTYLQNLKNKSTDKKKKETKNNYEQETEISDDNDDILLCNNQPLHCLHEAICLRTENNTAYCSRGNILYNVRCAECNNIFNKLTQNNGAHICTNLGKGCDYALCEKCFTKELVNEMQPARRRRG